MYSRTMLLAATTLLHWASTEPPPPCTPGTYIPHSTDCSSYFYCDNLSIQRHLSCTPGYNFNPESTACELGFTCSEPVPSSKEQEVNDAGEEKEGWTLVGGPILQEDKDKEIKTIPNWPSEGVPEDEVKKYVDQTTTVESEDGENNSKLFGGPLISALKNFTKALDIGVESKEETDTEKEGRELLIPSIGELESNVTTSGVPSNSTEVPTGFETTSMIASESTPDSSSEKKVEGRCGADSVVVGYPTVAPLVGRKAEEDSEEVDEDGSKTDEVGHNLEEKLEAEIKNITDSYTLATLWPLFSISNGSLENDQVGKDLLELSPVLVHKSVPQNVSSEEITDTKVPDYSFSDVRQFNPSTPLSPSPFNTKGDASDSVSAEKVNTEILNAEEENPASTEKVEEIEKAKGTLIFESHTTIKPTDSVGYFPEGQSKVVIGNPIL